MNAEVPKEARSMYTMETSPTILLMNGWQAKNIGDIAHTPGAIALIQRHMPSARIILWSNGLDYKQNERQCLGVPPESLSIRDMLARNYPDLRFVQGRLDDAGNAENDALDQAIREADFLLHGSGALLVRRRDMLKWKRHVSKPYGIYGITLDPDRLSDLSPQSAEAEVFSECRFLYVRETASLKNARSLTHAPTQFAPDSTFAFDLEDPCGAEELMAEHGLAHKDFAVFIPRMRLTPNGDPSRDEHNARFTMADMKLLIEVLVTYIDTTGSRVLIAPEMIYQIKLAERCIMPNIPRRLRNHVTMLRRYWLPDQARSLYARAVAVVSMENHSPILAYTTGVPALYIQQPEDTIKGQMWRDLEAHESILPIGQNTSCSISQKLMDLVNAPNESIHDVRASVELARRVSDQAMASVADSVQASQHRLVH